MSKMGPLKGRAGIIDALGKVMARMGPHGFAFRGFDAWARLHRWRHTRCTA